MPEMEGPVGLPMTRWSSGTSWQPDATPMFGVMQNVGGWMFMNLNNQAIHDSAAAAAVYTAQRVGFGSTGPAPPLRGSRTLSQNWVIISMFGSVGANRLSVDFDAAWLGNGCSAPEPATERIAPVNERFGPLVCPPGFVPGTPPCAAGTAPPQVNP